MPTTNRSSASKRLADVESTVRPSSSRGTSSVPVAIGVMILGVFAFVMAFGFATHPDSNEQTNIIFGGVFFLIGIALFIGGAAWCRNEIRKK